MCAETLYPAPLGFAFWFSKFVSFTLAERLFSVQWQFPTLVIPMADLIAEFSIATQKHLSDRSSYPARNTSSPLSRPLMLITPTGCCSWPDFSLQTLADAARDEAPCSIVAYAAPVELHSSAGLDLSPSGA